MEEQLARFVQDNPDAAMITHRQDGTSHMARIELGLVDGRLRGTGSAKLVRTRNLRRDPRSSLFVIGPYPRWAGLETTVTLLEGSEAGPLLASLMRARHPGKAPEGMVFAHDDQLGGDRVYSEREYTERVIADGRLIYDFTILRAYGKY
jgi:hypothetical protein